VVTSSRWLQPRDIRSGCSSRLSLPSLKLWFAQRARQTRRELCACTRISPKPERTWLTSLSSAAHPSLSLTEVAVLCSADRFRSDIVRLGNGSVNSSVPRFATSNAKSELDWIAKNASALPSCQQYGNTSTVALNKTSTFVSAETGGFMTRSNGVDAEAMRRRLSASFPGPGHYGNPALGSPSGGRMSTSKNITGLDVHVRTFKYVPGPGSYPLPQLDRYRAVKEPPAGRFSQSSLAAGSMYSNLKDTPAPDAYQNGSSSFLAGTIGGRISTSNRTTELDEKIRLGKTMPGYLSLSHPQPSHHTAPLPGG